MHRVCVNLEILHRTWFWSFNYVLAWAYLVSKYRQKLGTFYHSYQNIQKLMGYSWGCEVIWSYTNVSMENKQQKSVRVEKKKIWNWDKLFKLIIQHKLLWFTQNFAMLLIILKTFQIFEQFIGEIFHWLSTFHWSYFPNYNRELVMGPAVTEVY